MKFDVYIKQRCKELALKSNYKTKHGCIIVYKNIILAETFNINMPNVFTDRYSNNLKPLHAEALAIMRCFKKHHRILHKAELYVCRINNEGKLLISKPCEMCETIIKAFKIKTINYTTNDGKWVKEVYE
jgi:tRNA(Arg) A34 adenosine deaminase TadA